MKQKLQALKKKYKEKINKLPKECSFCNNMVEMNLSNFTMTYDKDGRVKTRSTPRSKSTWTYDSVTGKPATISHTDANANACIGHAARLRTRG